MEVRQQHLRQQCEQVCTSLLEDGLILILIRGLQYDSFFFSSIYRTVSHHTELSPVLEVR